MIHTLKQLNSVHIHKPYWSVSLLSSHLQLPLPRFSFFDHNFVNIFRISRTCYMTSFSSILLTNSYLVKSRNHEAPSCFTFSIHLLPLSKVQFVSTLLSKTPSHVLTLRWQPKLHAHTRNKIGNARITQQCSAFTQALLQLKRNNALRVLLR